MNRRIELYFRPILLAVAMAGVVAGCGDDRKPVAPNTSQSESKPAAIAKSDMQTRHWPFLDAAASNAAEAAPAGNQLVKNYYMVLDGSGSMKESACSGSLSKMEAAKNAVLTFAQSFPADANLGLLVFDRSGINEVLTIGRDNRDQFSALVKAVHPDSGTPLKSAIERAYQALTRQAKKQFGYGEYHLVVVTDGEADSGQDPGAIVNRILKESPVVVHTIGFCIGKNHSLNQPGRTLYRAADNPEQLRQQLGEVLAEAQAFNVTQFSKQ